jgi:hypothetical protein
MSEGIKMNLEKIVTQDAGEIVLYYSLWNYSQKK